MPTPAAGRRHARTYRVMPHRLHTPAARSVDRSLCSAGPGRVAVVAAAGDGDVGCMAPTAWCFCVRRNVQCVGRRTNEPSIHPSAGSASVHHHYELLPPFHNIILSSITHIYI